MKKSILFTAILSLFVLTGCQEEASQNNVDTENSTQQTEIDTSVSGTESEQSEKEPTEEKTDEETTEEESVPFTYKVNPETFTIEPIDDAESQVALLTFDDAPDENAIEIAEILQEHDAPAIFFVNGMYLESDQGREDLKQLHEMGFEIGNHTQTHVSLPEVSEEEQYEEIVQTSDLIEEITGERPRFFRAPFGQNTDYSGQVAEDEGMVLMNWTYGYDWKSEYQDPESLADIMVNTSYLNDGANLLMHDRTWTRDAMEDIISGLREKDYTLVNPERIYSPTEGGEAE